ncbi:MAG TPA: hypothetical protein VGL03_09475 [Thermoanaerobaculia bacterium]|jgi:hypothetical protein
MAETERARIRVFLNDPAGRGDRLVDFDPPQATEKSPWGFRVEAKAPEPRAYEPDTSEFLYWQLSAALERGKRLWSQRLPGTGTWIPGPVLPAVPVAGKDLNAYYDRTALRFFRDVDAKTNTIIQAGESPDIVTHEQGHAVLDSLRPDLWDAPHFEVAAFHEAFGDLSAIFVALAEPSLAGDVLEETKGVLSRSNLVSRLAEEIGAAVRDRYGSDAAPRGALRDAVNSFEYVDPKSLPDSAPSRSLSAEPHSFCRVMTGACWDALVEIFRTTAGEDRADALRRAAEETARFVVAASETAPSGADFFGRVARRFVREARAAGESDLSATLAERFFQRRLLASPQVPADLFPDEEPGIMAPPEGEPPSPALLRAAERRLGPDRPGEILTLGMSVAPTSRPRVLHGRRKRDLFLYGPEYGPANGAAVEISDSFALGFDEMGFLTASRVHRAEDTDEEDARAFVRFLVRRDQIAAESERPPESERLAFERKTHAVVREDDGVRRLRRVWIAGRCEP